MKKQNFKTLATDAYAKINLTLDVVGRRADGYHNLETVMHTVSLCDRVLVRQSAMPGITLGCNLPYLPRDGRNIAVKAANAFFEAAQIECPGIEIHIKKCIPVGAGMAGGSANAAAVLQLLNKMYDCPLPPARMHALALSLGADVPFCMMGGAALATGIGEVLTPAPTLPDCCIVVAKPPVSVSTPKAYQLLDEYAELEHPPAAPLLRAMEQKDLGAVCAALGNSFQAPIEAEKPVIGEIRRSLQQSGAMGALMTGSGSAVFGIFADKAQADAAAGVLSKRFREVYVVRPVAQL